VLLLTQKSSSSSSRNLQLKRVVFFFNLIFNRDFLFIILNIQKLFHHKSKTLAKYGNAHVLVKSFPMVSTMQQRARLWFDISQCDKQTTFYIGWECEICLDRA
jgi:hypothetical protein